MHLSKRLELLAAVLLVLLVGTQAIAGLLNLGANVDFLAKVAGFYPGLAAVALVIVYLTELAVVAVLCIPTSYNAPLFVAWLCIALASALGVEAVLASAAGDRTARIKLLFLILTTLKQAVVAMDLKRTRGVNIGDETLHIVDLDSLKVAATSAHASILSTVLIVVLVLYALCVEENAFSSKPLSRALGRASYSKVLSIVCFVATVGAEDRGARRSVEKFF